MGSYREGDFEYNMEQLIKILKRMAKSNPDPKQFGKLQDMFQSQGMNINFCFFNFFPLADEELDELEEICEQYLSDDDKRPEDLSTDLSSDDMEFLKQHGIRF